MLHPLYSIFILHLLYCIFYTASFILHHTLPDNPFEILKIPCFQIDYSTDYTGWQHKNIFILIFYDYHCIICIYYFYIFLNFYNIRYFIIYYFDKHRIYVLIFQYILIENVFICSFVNIVYRNNPIFQSNLLNILLCKPLAEQIYSYYKWHIN